MPFGDYEYQRSQTSPTDVLGVDAQCRALLRKLGTLPSSALVAVFGGPGSGKTEFMRRTAHFLVQEGCEGLHRGFCWYDPWAYGKQGHIISGLAAHIARIGPDPAAHLKRARDIVGHVPRMTFDGTMAAGAGVGLNPTDVDPIEIVIKGFSELVDAAKAGDDGRLVIFIDNLDAMTPNLRWQLLEGLRLLRYGKPDVIMVLCMGRESALAAIRAREGDVADATAAVEIDQLFDLTVHTPGLPVNKIGAILRTALEPGAEVIRAVFGNEAIMGLTTAAASRPFGNPRFLRKLANRVHLLAEYAQIAKATRELSESQWAWIIVTERWPEFRRFMIRGGRERWGDLGSAAAAMTRGGAPAETVRGEMTAWLEGDLLLADYLRLHAQGFERDTDGIAWLEHLLLDAGL